MTNNAAVCALKEEMQNVYDSLQQMCSSEGGSAPSVTTAPAEASTPAPTPQTTCGPNQFMNAEGVCRTKPWSDFVSCEEEASQGACAWGSNPNSEIYNSVCKAECDSMAPTPQTTCGPNEFMNAEGACRTKPWSDFVSCEEEASQGACAWGSDPNSEIYNNVCKAECESMAPDTDDDDTDDEETYGWRHTGYPTQDEKITSREECESTMRMLRGDDSIVVTEVNSQSYAPGCYMTNHPARATSYHYNNRSTAGGGQCTPMNSWSACAVRTEPYTCDANMNHVEASYVQTVLGNNISYNDAKEECKIVAGGKDFVLQQHSNGHTICNVYNDSIGGKVKTRNDGYTYGAVCTHN